MGMNIPLSFGAPSSRTRFEAAIATDESDQSAAVQRWIDAAAAFGGGDVILPSGTIGIAATVSLGNGSAGSASSYHNVRLIGQGSALLYSTSSATELKWVGTTDAANVMVDVAGPISGCGVEGIYLNANNKAGTCLRTRSVLASRFSGLLGQNYLSRGLHVTIQQTPASAAWYSTTNVFERCVFTSTNANTQAFRLEGTNDNGFYNDPHRNTFIGCLGSASRSLTTTDRPCALYLGYTDSNTFIECDFQLASLIEAGVYDDIAQMRLANGSGKTNGANYKLRYADNTVAGENVRREVYYQYNSSSSDADDGLNVIAPSDNIGRFLRYYGAAIMLDATVRALFPANNFFYGCAAIQGPSIENITTNGNTISRHWFENFTTKDAEEIPSIPYVSGRSDEGLVFGDHDNIIRKDNPEVILEQANSMRRTRLLLDADSTDGYASSGHGGTIFIHEERANDSASWTETGRMRIRRDGITNGEYVAEVTLANNTATSFATPFPCGFAEWSTSIGSSTRYGMAYLYQGVSGVTAAVADAIKLGSSSAVATTALTGTTGTSGNVTVSITVANLIYIENRAGLSLTINFRMRAGK